MDGFVSVHIGCGRHSEKNTKEYTRLISKACREAASALRRGFSASAAVAVAISILEDSPLTNAGRGSCLSEEGQVECDAAIMTGPQGIFGAVSAITNVQNPITVAEKLCFNQENGEPELGRVPPSVLAGDGAKAFAEKQGIPIIPTQSLITDSSYKQYLTFMDRVCQHRRKKAEKQEIENNCRNHVDVGAECEVTTGVGDSCTGNKMKRRGSEEEDVGRSKRLKTNNSNSPALPFEDVSDTVGAVCVDVGGRIASGVSSGGIALKQKGRVGHASQFGCGCWADESSGSSTSGCGEQLVRMQMAQRLADAMKIDNVSMQETYSVMKKYLDQQWPRRDKSLGGGMVVTVEDSTTLQFVYTHTTSSMGLGYMTTSNPSPKVRISRLPEGSEPGTTIVIEGTAIRLSKKVTPPTSV